MKKKQILAMGGAALPPELDNLLLVDYFLKQTGKRKPKVAFIGAAHGDADGGRLRFYAGFSQFTCRPTHLPLFARTPRDLASFVLEQDAIYVGGGNTRSMLAVWREWGLDRHLRSRMGSGRRAGRRERGLDLLVRARPDRFGRRAADRNALPRFLAGANCPHYDSEPRAGRRCAGSSRAATLPEALAADDGVALHFVGTGSRASSAAGRAQRPTVCENRATAQSRPGFRQNFSARGLEKSEEMSCDLIYGHCSSSAPCLSGALVQAQDYPTRPVRVLVPYTPGGITDLVTRIAASELAKSFSQTVVVDNRPGANSILRGRHGVEGDA